MVLERIKDPCAVRDLEGDIRTGCIFRLGELELDGIADSSV